MKVKDGRLIRLAVSKRLRKHVKSCKTCAKVLREAEEKEARSEKGQVNAQS